MTKHLVCTKQTLMQQDTIEFTLPNQLDDQPTTAIILYHQDHIYGYINRCPHLNIPLNWQPDTFLNAEKTHLQCATHGALFLLATGECVSGPCFGDTLSPLSLECDADDRIWLKVP